MVFFSRRLHDQSLRAFVPFLMPLKKNDYKIENIFKISIRNGRNSVLEHKERERSRQKTTTTKTNNWLLKCTKKNVSCQEFKSVFLSSDIFSKRLQCRRFEERPISLAERTRERKIMTNKRKKEMEGEFFHYDWKFELNTASVVNENINW